MADWQDTTDSSSGWRGMKFEISFQCGATRSVYQGVFLLDTTGN